MPTHTTQPQTILVTGASSGIGEATARLFGNQGHRVVLAARRMERLQALAQEIQAAGGEALPVETDVTSLEDIARMVQAALEHFGRIDILFNNAGFGRLNWLETLDPKKDIEAQLMVNLLGVIQTTRQVLPHMIAQKSGHIINMVSIAGLVATPTYSIYSAGKFGVRGFSEALRREVGVYGIHVSAIYPGGAKTEFTEHAGIQRKTRATTPASLRLSAEDIAQAVLRVARHPRRTTILPRPFLLAVWLNGLFPALFDWIVEERFVKPERGL